MLLIAFGILFPIFHIINSHFVPIPLLFRPLRLVTFRPAYLLIPFCPSSFVFYLSRPPLPIPSLISAADRDGSRHLSGRDQPPGTP